MFGVCGREAQSEGQGCEGGGGGGGRVYGNRLGQLGEAVTPLHKGLCASLTSAAEYLCPSLAAREASQRYASYPVLWIIM